MILSIHTDDLHFVRRGAPANAKIGLTSGCFDLVHYMHLVYLERCRRLCDVLVVGVDSDDLVRRVKGPKRPMIPEVQRQAMVNALKCVDATFIMGSVEDFEYVVRSLQVSYVFKKSGICRQDRGRCAAS